MCRSAARSLNVRRQWGHSTRLGSYVGGPPSAGVQEDASLSHLSAIRAARSVARNVSLCCFHLGSPATIACLRGVDRGVDASARRLSAATAARRLGSARAATARARTLSLRTAAACAACSPGRAGLCFTLAQIAWCVPSRSALNLRPHSAHGSIAPPLASASANAAPPPACPAVLAAASPARPPPTASAALAPACALIFLSALHAAMCSARSPLRYSRRQPGHGTSSAACFLRHACRQTREHHHAAPRGEAIKHERSPERSTNVAQRGEMVSPSAEEGAPGGNAARREGE